MKRKPKWTNRQRAIKGLIESARMRDDKEAIERLQKKFEESR